MRRLTSTLFLFATLAITSSCGHFSHNCGCHKKKCGEKKQCQRGEGSQCDLKKGQKKNKS